MHTGGDRPKQAWVCGFPKTCRLLLLRDWRGAKHLLHASKTHKHTTNARTHVESDIWRIYAVFYVPHNIVRIYSSTSTSRFGLKDRKADQFLFFTLRAAWPISVIPFPYDLPLMVHLRKSITFWVNVPVLSLNTCVIYATKTKRKKTGRRDCQRDCQHDTK